MVAMLLNTAVNVLMYNAQENALEVSHYAGECSRWQQRVALLLTMLSVAIAATLSCLQRTLSQRSSGCLRFMTTMSCWDLGR